MTKTFGPNWKTTLIGVLLAAVTAYTNGMFQDPADIRLWLAPVLLAVLGYLSKDKQVTGGSIAQTPAGRVDVEGTAKLQRQRAEENRVVTLS